MFFDTYCHSCHNSIKVSYNESHNEEAYYCVNCIQVYNNTTPYKQKICSCGAHACKLEMHDHYCDFYHKEQFYKPEFRKIEK